ncbi:MAG TPA: TIR domain-containing protein [Caulobacteraceae bacterium]
MSDVFISYARSTASQAQQVAEALRALGYGVWRDDELPAHQDYSKVIEERLRAAKAVVVVWSAEAVKSRWVCAEADVAHEAGTLVQLSLDGAIPPLPFNRIQCADMRGWSGDLDAPGWRKVAASVADLLGAAPEGRTPQSHARKLSICVLPFANMSGDPEQEYFSDGISEDVITDLSKVSALEVVSRNTAFSFKGKAVEVGEVARKLNVSHVLEGSVRKAGGRVRITAQLIDGSRDSHIWADRYDRDLTDIFALQDEISEAIVAALKLKLLPEEKKAIERRGTDDAEAYDLYLMARQHWVSGNEGDPRRVEAMIRLTRRAVEIDPNYARAWALMGRAQTSLRFNHSRRDIDSWETVEKTLAVDPELAEAHALKAIHLRYEGRLDEAAAEAEIALRLDPESYDANRAAAHVNFNLGRIAGSVPYWEKAAALMEADFTCAAMLMTSYTALGDAEGIRRSARMTVERAETALAQDRSNGSALGYGVGALAALGEAERARDWARRALLIDPDNMNMRYNLGCALSAQLGDIDGAIDLLGPYFARATEADEVSYAKIDPDLDAIRNDPRFQAMIAEAEARMTAEAGRRAKDATA